MKKYIPLLLLFFAGVLIITCPDRDDHVEAVKRAVIQASRATAEQDDNAISSIMSAIFAPAISEWMLESSFEVENYFFFSLGKISYENDTKTISLGLLNHIFTYDKEDLLELMQEQVKE